MDMTSDLYSLILRGNPVLFFHIGFSFMAYEAISSFVLISLVGLPSFHNWQYIFAGAHFYCPHHRLVRYWISCVLCSNLLIPCFFYATYSSVRYWNVFFLIWSSKFALTVSSLKGKSYIPQRSSAYPIITPIIVLKRRPKSIFVR